MTGEQWKRLSDWHNAWLDADGATRLRLREDLALSDPDLLADADNLLADRSSLLDFLDTPAFVLAARRMARDATTLAPGAEVGPYRIVGLIAHGGMGVVYRASDTRLHRDVALKMLTPIDVPDAPRVDRFLREARITASLEHPNIVTVYDVGVFQGHPYIVAELLTGETLRARLDRGGLPAAAACAIVIDVGRGLVAAHSAGLVHRDLKPENIFLTKGGGLKILDFGIAKLAPDAGRPNGTPSTGTGILLGTAGYLAPEQITGSPVDARADLFAVGALLFEVSTGRRAFAGANTIDTLYAILHTPFAEASVAPSNIPAGLLPIVSRLLEKDPDRRFQSAADLVWALEQQEPGTHSERTTPRPSRGRSPVPARWLLAAATAAVLMIAAATWRSTAASGRASESSPVTRFTVTLPEGTGMFSAPAVSPDGRRICWAGGPEVADTRVFVRDLSSLDAAAIPGTEGARHPFWAPDGLTIGFFAQGKLKRTALAGGSPVILADAPNPRGGTWSRSGVIVFEPDYRDTPLMRVSDRGGPVQPVTVFNRAQEEVVHRWPAFLPDGIHFLYSIVSLRDDRRGVYIGRVDVPPTQSTDPLFLSESGAFYAPVGDLGRGVLLSVAQDRIEYRPFDAVRLALEGAPRTIGIEAVGTSPHHAALLSAGGDVMTYSTVRVPWGARFATVATDGTGLRFLSERELGGFPRISPDGGRLARTRVEPPRENSDVWVEDVQRGTRLRLTTSADHDLMPVWSPDGREVAYRSGTLQKATIGFAAADGTGVLRSMPCPKDACEPSDWSPDGHYLVVTVQSRDIWAIPLTAGEAPYPLLAESFTERDARVSPDGKWLAYVSDESGQAEVSVRSMAGAAPRRFVISSDGGDQPAWRHDGAELFFATRQGQLQSVTVQSDPRRGLVFGAPVRRKVPVLGERHWGTTYDVSADGRRVYFPHPETEQAPRAFGAVMNWGALVRP